MAKKQDIKADERISKAAIDLFQSQGFEVTTFAQIAKKAGLSQPAIYVYFEDKMDLLNHICLRSAEIGRLYIDKKINPNERALIRFKQYFEANIDFFHHERAYAQALMSAYYFSSSHPKMLSTLQLIEKTTMARIESFLYQCTYEGVCKISEVSELAISVHSVLVGECYKSIYLKKDDSLQKLKARGWNSVLTLLHHSEFKGLK